MTKRIVFALICAHLLTAGWALLPAEWYTVKANYFIDQTVQPGGMEKSWYYKFFADYLLHSVGYACFASIAYCHSRKLFFVMAVFNLYHILDFIMFLVNFSKPLWLYVTFFIMIIVVLVIMLAPIKDKAPVVRMK